MGGTDHWRHDKQAFKAWAKEASEPGSSKAKRELYGFLALSFGDVDTDKDGLINAEQFDQLLAEVSAIPRRYGLAPPDVGDAVSRAVNHKILFDSLDKTGRGALTLDQFVEWPTHTLSVLSPRSQLAMLVCTTSRTTLRSSTLASLR